MNKNDLIFFVNNFIKYDKIFNHFNLSHNYNRNSIKYLNKWINKYQQILFIK